MIENPPQVFETARTSRRDAFAGRLLDSVANAMDVFGIYLGDQLGLYQVLADDGPITSGELARRTGTHERYIREWLEQQATSGILDVDNAQAEPGSRRFHLPLGHDEVLAEKESLYFLAPLAQLFAGAVRPLAQVVDAYRTGAGVPFSEYGHDAREGQARINRTMFLQELGAVWIPSIPDLHERLLAEPFARVADLGCGAGWSSIGLALAYPEVRVDGFDLDAPSIAMANANLAAMHSSRVPLEDRVRFDHRDAASSSLSGSYDLVMALECLHDMAQPVDALRTMRRLVKPGGSVLVVDERVSDRFLSGTADPERIMYGWSILHCLPVGMADAPSAGTGTVMRPATLLGYARAAGFESMEILPIDNLFFRFYRLR